MKTQSDWKTCEASFRAGVGGGKLVAVGLFDGTWYLRGAGKIEFKISADRAAEMLGCADKNTKLERWLDCVRVFLLQSNFAGEFIEFTNQDSVDPPRKLEYEGWGFGDWPAAGYRTGKNASIQHVFEASALCCAWVQASTDAEVKLKATILPALRRGYRREIRAWMKVNGLKTNAQAAKALGISESTLKSIMSSVGERKYGPETLQAVLEKIRT